MLRIVVCVALALAIFALGAVADEYKGRIKSVDPAKNTITVTIGDKDQEFKVPATARITSGEKDVKGGLGGKAFTKTGGEVTITTEKKDGAETVTAIKLTGKKKQDK